MTVKETAMAGTGARSRHAAAPIQSSSFQRYTIGDNVLPRNALCSKRRSTERRQFQNVSDVRHEATSLYWRVKDGKIDPNRARSLTRLLDLIAKLMIQDEATAQLNKLSEQVSALRLELQAAGADQDLPQSAIDFLDNLPPLDPKEFN